ncbi:putative membrane protein [Vibrio parahaemolyticus 970107]|nr:putative membrane protein [Vibrio parahaemolyticus 970107]
MLSKCLSFSTLPSFLSTLSFAGGLFVGPIYSFNNLYSRP